MAKTYIIYARGELHATLFADVVGPAREAGHSSRLIGIEFFRKGEPETGAAGVAVVRYEGDEAVFRAIEETYPDLEVISASEDNLNLPKISLDQNGGKADSSDDDLKSLRLELINLGGSVSAGMSAEELREAISDQRVAAQQAEDDKMTAPAQPEAAQQAEDDKMTAPAQPEAAQQAEDDKMTAPAQPEAAQVKKEASTPKKEAGK